MLFLKLNLSATICIPQYYRKATLGNALPRPALILKRFASIYKDKRKKLKFLRLMLYKCYLFVIKSSQIRCRFLFSSSGKVNFYHRNYNFNTFATVLHTLNVILPLLLIPRKYKKVCNVYVF